MLSEKPGSERWETLESSLFACLLTLVLFPRCSSCSFAILVTKTCFSSASNLQWVDYFSLREKDLPLILKIITLQCREGEFCIRWLPAVRCIWATAFHSGKVMAETGLLSEHCTRFKVFYSGDLCCFPKIEARWHLFNLLPQCRQSVLFSPVFRYLIESPFVVWLMLYDAQRKMRSCCILPNFSFFSVQEHLKKKDSNLRVCIYISSMWYLQASLKTDAKSRFSFLCNGSTDLLCTGFEELWLKRHEILTSVPIGGLLFIWAGMAFKKKVKRSTF